LLHTKGKAPTVITQKILVVDDEENVCRSINRVLSRKGYEVSQALNVEDAVKRIKEMTFDLVITDLMIPRTSGMELLKIIREDYPELDVIMITGYASIESAVKATKLGASAYLPKPFTPDELTEVTQKMLDKRMHRTGGESKRVTAHPNDEPPGEMIDIDMPFGEKEVAKYTSREYVEALTHSDVPLSKKIAERTQDHRGKEGRRRVVGKGKDEASKYPLKKEKPRTKASPPGEHMTSEHIDVDLPFNGAEVERAAGIDYVNSLTRSDIPLAALYSRDAPARYSVLVVDDEPIICHSVRKILTGQSCGVDEAFDVDAALAKMKLNKYDLVLLDLKMPKRSGMEVLRSIKSQWPELPVIIVTGHGSIETAIEATKLGAFDFIAKPFTPDELAKAAAEALAA
jgi:DNA-binding response OmpR family regulator